MGKGTTAKEPPATRPPGTSSAFFRHGGFSELFCKVVLLAGCIVRIASCFSRRWWGDTYALKAGIFTHSLPELLTTPLGFGQSAPVGYVLVSKLLGTVSGYSLPALLVPALAAGLASLFLLDATLKEMGLLRVRPFALSLVAFSPTLVFYSTEFKPYGIDFLVSLAAVFVMQRFWTGRRPWRTLFALCVLAPLFSTTALMVLPVLGAGILYVLFENRKKDGLLPGPAVVCAVALALGGGIAVFYMFRTMPPSMFDYWKNDFAPFPGSKEALLWYLDRAVDYFRGPIHFGYMPPASFWGRVVLAALPLGLFVAGTASLRKHFLPWMTVLLLLLLLCASGAHHWPIRTGKGNLGSRLLLFTAPFVLLVVCAGLEAAWRRFRFPVAGCVAVYVGLFEVFLLWRARFPAERVEEAVSFVSGALRPDQTVYMDGYCDVVLMVERPGWREEALQERRLIRFGTFALPVDRLRTSRTRTLFVLGHDGKHYLENTIGGLSGFRVVHEWDFPPAKLFKLFVIPDKEASAASVHEGDGDTNER